MNQLGNGGSAASAKAQGSANGRLTNRIALVTGASRGLGRFFAETLAREGAHVILGNRSDVPEITEGIARAGGNANFVEMDVTRDDSILGAFEQIVTQWGPPSVVVNNAGITDVADTLKEDPAEFDRVISTNLRGPWMIAREAARHLVAANFPGAIVNVASILALRQAGQVTAYATAKAGLVQMTKQLALEWARYRIRVNALAPGYVETDFNRDFFATEKGQEMIRRIPSRRLTPMQDLAEPLILLAGDGGASITGVVLPVDAGHLLSGL
jgi:NAD(P)-dependent dehydrogenase (short-subunit alcohol dehydrogenase family)